MSSATERITVLVTKTQKQQLTARAKAAGMSAGEFIRRASESYSPSEDEALLEGLLNQVAKTSKQAERSIDEALASVAASEQRLAKIDASRERKVA